MMVFRDTMFLAAGPASGCVVMHLNGIRRLNVIATVLLVSGLATLFRRRDCDFTGRVSGRRGRRVWCSDAESPAQLCYRSREMPKVRQAVQSADLQQLDRPKLQSNAMP